MVLCGVLLPRDYRRTCQAGEKKAGAVDNATSLALVSVWGATGQKGGAHKRHTVCAHHALCREETCPAAKLRAAWAGVLPARYAHLPS